MPDVDQPQPGEAKVERRAAIIALAAGIALLILKFIAFHLTGSAAVYSDAMESIVNVLASAFALYAIILAHRPADRDHPYGHGKVEFLAAGFEGGMIVLAAIFIAWEAIARLVHGSEVTRIDLGLLLIVIGMLVNGAIGFYLIHQGKKGGSITLESDGKHLMSDAITSLVVLAALGIMRVTGWTLIDPLAALIVAAYLIFLAIGLLRQSAAGLMDQQDRSDDRLIREILDSHLVPAGKPPLICSYHKLRHRHSGRYHWVDFHIMVPSRLNIDQGHQIASKIEYEIEQSIGEGNATAHVEPCVDTNCPECVVGSGSVEPSA